MTADELLFIVEACGGNLTVSSNGKLIGDAPEKLIPELREHKAELIALLRRRELCNAERMRQLQWIQ